MPAVSLRPVDDDDLDALFALQRDPEAVRMAAFVWREPDDRPAFEEHMARVRGAPDTLLRAVTRDGALVGTVGSFPLGDERHITYWIDRAVWGRGVATRAVALLLELDPVRPLHASAASDNAGSLRVLQKAGFRIVGTEVTYTRARAREIEETVLVLDA